MTTWFLGVAGRFTGLDHIIRLADRTPSWPLRHTLLRVLQAALLPAFASRSDISAAAGLPVGSGGVAAASEAALANCDAFLAAGGVPLAVDLLACALAGFLVIAFVLMVSDPTRTSAIPSYLAAFSGSVPQVHRLRSTRVNRVARLGMHVQAKTIQMHEIKAPKIKVSHVHGVIVSRCTVVAGRPRRQASRGGLAYLA